MDNPRGAWRLQSDYSHPVPAPCVASYRFVAGLPLEPAVSVPPLLGLRPPAAVAAALVTAGLLAAGSESWLYSLS